MAKEPPTLGSIDAKLEQVGAAVDGLNSLAASLLKRLEALEKKVSTASPQPAPTPVMTAKKTVKKTTKVPE